ncbi:MAG: hypothetical protein AAFY76_09330, partial [Cyanobacteria bacterium J06649_11]
MTKSDNTGTGFALHKITTDQFAIIDDKFTEDEGAIVNLRSQFRFGLDPESKILLIKALFIYNQKEIPFLIIETGCHFKILKESWNAYLDKEHNVISFPKDFITHLAVIAVGTSRGVLHAKTENT